MKFEINSHIKSLNLGIGQIKEDILNSFTQTIINKSLSGKHIFVAGNGGSASIANHFVTDLIGGFQKTNFKIKVSSLSSNDSLITALGNDYGYDNVFSNQIKKLASKEDLLILISSSGMSPNIVKAAECAQEMGLEVFSMVGFEGGHEKLRKSSTLVFHVKTQVGQYEIVEDVHGIFCHSLKLEILNQWGLVESNE